jgi:hypothetical protein
MEKQMKVLEFFDSRKRANDEVYRRYQEHLAKEKAMFAEFNRIDVSECIPLASEYAARKFAGSPLALETEVKLIKARAKRDDLRYQYRRIREDFERQLEVDSRPVVTEASEKYLALVKNLSSRYRFERLNEIRTSEGTMVRIRTNGDALQAAKERILGYRKVLHEMLHQPLSAIEAQIDKFDDEITKLDLSVLEIEEVSREAASSRRPQQDIGGVDVGTQILPGQPIWIHAPQAATAQISQLKDRISALEKN